MSRRERALYLCGIIILCVFLRFYCHKQPCSGRQAAKQTDAAVATVEQTIKSQDAAINEIVTGAHKEVLLRNETIRKDVSSLGPDGVAADLMALLDEYRGERRGN